MTISRNGRFQKQINFYTKEDSVLLFRQGEKVEGFCVTLLGLSSTVHVKTTLQGLTNYFTSPLCGDAGEERAIGFKDVFLILLDLGKGIKCLHPL